MNVKPLNVIPVRIVTIRLNQVGVQLKRGAKINALYK
jgi:hypothetical protein